MSRKTSVVQGVVFHPYLRAIREGLVSTLPVLVVGVVLSFIVNLPIPGYQNMCRLLFGDFWMHISSFVYNVMLGIMAIIISLSISFSLAHEYSRKYLNDFLPPVMVAFVALGCLLCTISPDKSDTFLLAWLGGHGLLHSILSTLLAWFFFRFFLKFRWLRLPTYSVTSSAPVAQSVGVIIPSLLTLSVFIGYNILTTQWSHFDVHSWFVAFLLEKTAAHGGQDLGTAGLFVFIHQLIIFLSAQSVTIVEPIMEQVYIPALNHNSAMHELSGILSNAGQSISQLVYFGQDQFFLFTKSFFTCFMDIGGSGGSLSLILGCLLRHTNQEVRKVAIFALVPAFFNMNEIIFFGLPVALNPLFMIPFFAVAFLNFFIAYVASILGFLPLTVHDVAWNMPIFLNGYWATGSVAGCLVQALSIVVGVLVYLPFIAFDNALKTGQMKNNFRSLVHAVSEEHGSLREDKLINKPNPVGFLACSLVYDLHQAVAKNQLYAVYQPQVNSDTGKVVGIESLLRWQHPVLGMIPPSVFIGLAEDSGEIQSLGLFSLEQSVRQLSEWHSFGLSKEVIMSINVSAQQLEDQGFSDKVESILWKWGVAPENIKFELTETVALSQEMLNNRILHNLHAMNIPLCIDDFGMGHSSLTYLKKFPVSSLKIDAGLSSDVLESSESAKIIFSITELCKDLHLDCVVEYVESEEHLIKLRSLGCTIVQGFFYSPPLTADACLDFIRVSHKAYGKLSIK